MSASRSMPTRFHSMHRVLIWSPRPASTIMCLLSERLRLTQSVCKVLRPAGMFAIFEHNPWNPVTRAIVRRCPIDVNAILMRSSETAALLAEVGFHPNLVTLLPFSTRSYRSKNSLTGELATLGSFGRTICGSW